MRCHCTQVSASSAQPPAATFACPPTVSYIAVSEAALHMSPVCIGGMLPELQVQADAMTPAEEDLIASWLTADDGYTVTGKFV